MQSGVDGRIVILSKDVSLEYKRQHLPRLQAEIARTLNLVVSAASSDNPVQDIGRLLSGINEKASGRFSVIALAAVRVKVKSEAHVVRLYAQHWLPTIEAAVCSALSQTLKAAPANPVIFLGRILLVRKRNFTNIAQWRNTFVACDPRRQILDYFRPGDHRGPYGYLRAIGERPGKGASSHFFSVWRPTSLIALRMMVDGTATGKGLNVKGKSAKQGRLSGFVPCNC